MPLPCQNCYGFFMMTVVMERFDGPKFALRIVAFVTLGVNLVVQGTLLFFIFFKMIGMRRDEDEKPELIGFILCACLFTFFVAMINNAKNGWLQSLLLCFAGGEEWGGEPPKGRRFASLTAHKRTVIIVFAVIPEIVLWGLQLYVGISYLSSCLSYIDLVMNSVALVFVSDVDEMIFEATVPTLIKTTWDQAVVMDAYYKPNPEAKGVEDTQRLRFQSLVFKVELFGVLPLVGLMALAVSSLVEPPTTDFERLSDHIRS